MYVDTRLLCMLTTGQRGGETKHMVQPSGSVRPEHCGGGDNCHMAQPGCVRETVA